MADRELLGFRFCKCGHPFRAFAVPYGAVKLVIYQDAQAGEIGRLCNCCPECGVELVPSGMTKEPARDQVL